MTRVVHVLQSGPITVSVVQQLETHQARANGRWWAMASLVPLQVNITIGEESQTFLLPDAPGNA